MNTLLRTCLLTVVLACLGIAEEFSGRVVAVMDGDTITVLLGREQRRVRLAGVDAPEKGQAFGQRSKQALSQMVFGRQRATQEIRQCLDGLCLPRSAQLKAARSTGTIPVVDKVAQVNARLLQYTTRLSCT